MEPSAHELLELTTVGMIMTWIGIDDVNRSAIHSIIGTTDATHPRTVAGISPASFDAAFLDMHITVGTLLPRALSLAERSHIGILRETCCLVAGIKKTGEAVSEVGKRDIGTSPASSMTSKSANRTTVIKRSNRRSKKLRDRSRLRAERMAAAKSDPIAEISARPPRITSCSYEESSSHGSDPCDYLEAVIRAESDARLKGDVERAEMCARIAAKVRRSRTSEGEN